MTHRHVAEARTGALSPARVGLPTPVEDMATEGPGPILW